jgi:hypothetical protein
MLDFKQFITNAGAFLSNGNDYDSVTKQLRLPDTTADIPTISTNKPVKIFKIKRTGKTYEICAENNVIWNCPAHHYEYLNLVGKAPHVGDRVDLTFYKDGTVKSFNLVKHHKQTALEPQ